MEAKNINTTIYVANMEELDEKDRQLVEAAIEATKRVRMPRIHTSTWVPP